MFHKHNIFHLLYLSLVQSQNLLHRNMACISYLGLSIYIHTINLAADITKVELEEHMETRIGWSQRCTCRSWSCELGDVLKGRVQVTLAMNLEGEIEWAQRCTMEAIIEWVCRPTWRQRLSALRDELGGHNQASMEMHLEAMIVWTWRL